MTNLIQQIVSLGETLTTHTGETHWTISKKISTKSDALHRLHIGGDMNTRTYEARLLAFAEIWPADLEWPADIPRPEAVPAKRKAS